MNGSQIIRDLKDDAAECARIAREMPVGTKIHMMGVVGEVTKIDGRHIIVKAGGVERPTTYAEIMVYVASGKATLERTAG